MGSLIAAMTLLVSGGHREIRLQRPVGKMLSFGGRHLTAQAAYGERPDVLKFDLTGRLVRAIRSPRDPQTLGLRGLDAMERPVYVRSEFLISDDDAWARPARDPSYALLGVWGNTVISARFPNEIVLSVGESPRRVFRFPSGYGFEAHAYDRIRGTFAMLGNDPSSRNLRICIMKPPSYRVRILPEDPLQILPSLDFDDFGHLIVLRRHPVPRTGRDLFDVVCLDAKSGRMIGTMATLGIEQPYSNPIAVARGSGKIFVRLTSTTGVLLDALRD